MENVYLLKHAKKSALFRSAPADDLQMVVVIPAYDEPSILLCLDSLYEADIPLSWSVEIYVIVNHPDTAASELIDRSAEQVGLIRKYHHEHRHPRLHLFAHLEVMPQKSAGVGLARKIGMDEAVRRFDRIGHDGIIANLDADCTVMKNYFVSIFDFMQQHPKVSAAGVYFEHPLERILDKRIQHAIINYELHLRYFIEAQRLVGLPFAFQTIGSCMIVRSSSYQQMGGMNVRKAGEDFYFLHKFIAINRFSEVLGTAVYPSPRASFRVPFGTGRAVRAALLGNQQCTYHWESFQELQVLVNILGNIYDDLSAFNNVEKESPVLWSYLMTIDGRTKIREIYRQTSQYSTFRNRFYQWFNAFRLMKYLHFARAQYPDQPVVAQAKVLQQKLDPNKRFTIPKELLYWYRARSKV